MELSLLILVCIHKLYIVYLEIYVVPIGHGFSFFGHGKVVKKSWKINVEKEGAPCVEVLISLLEVKLVLIHRPFNSDIYIFQNNGCKRVFYTVLGTKCAF